MIIDLRSDTVTKPTKAMLEMMFDAAVGDDVFNEDPTILALEQKAAKLFNLNSSTLSPSPPPEAASGLFVAIVFENDVLNPLTVILEGIVN